MNLINLTFLLSVLYLGEALEIPQAKRDLLPSIESCGTYNYCEGFPWLVNIPLRSEMGYSNSVLQCAGTLISRRYVITHESCVKYAVFNVVYIGQEILQPYVGCDEDQQPPEFIRVKSIEFGEEWNVALFRLEKDVVFRNDVQPICLPFDNFKRSEIHEHVFTPSWDQHQYTDEPISNTSTKITYKIISNEDCIKDGVIANDDSKVFCAMQDRNTNQNACYAEEGGPIMSLDGDKFVLEGILSNASARYDTTCANEKPIYGQRVTEGLLQWIIDHVEA